MSKLSALLSVTLLALAACVTEEPAELDRPGDSMEYAEPNQVEDDFGDRRDRLPVEQHPGAMDGTAPAPITFPTPSQCVVVSSAQARAVVDATRRALVLIDRDIAEGEPGSIELAHQSREAFAAALAHAEVARDTLLDGPLSLDGDATTVIDAEGAVVRAAEHEAILELSRGIDLAVERAGARHKLDRQAGVSARQAATVAGKALGAAHELRSYAIECELGVWR